jgi:hypothetical protein
MMRGAEAVPDPTVEKILTLLMLAFLRLGALEFFTAERRCGEIITLATRVESKQILWPRQAITVEEGPPPIFVCGSACSTVLFSNRSITCRPETVGQRCHQKMPSEHD